MAVIIGSARIDERGKATGGKAGDQTGNEISTQNWYKHSKGWRTFRAKDPNKATKIAECMKWACGCSLIGYDQSENTSLYKALEKVDFDLNRLNTKVETDCARLVRVCCRYAGIQTSDFYTGNEASALLASGEFTELTGNKYNTQSDYLKAGDIQVTKSKGHTIVVLTNGPKAEANAVPEPDPVLDDRILRNGDEGADVKDLQKRLIALGYDVGSCGADGEFGDDTEDAVKKFQREHPPLEVDGEVGEQTIAALKSAANASGSTQQVQIVDGDCYIRSKADKGSQPIGVAKKGSTLPYLGETSADGWHKVEYNNKTGWVSGKYSKVI